MADLTARFLGEYVSRHCKPRTAEEYARAVNRFINPDLGKLNISDLSRADVGRFHHKHGDIPYQANRNLAALSKMMNLAELWGLRPDGSNPCRHIEKYDEAKRERFLTAVELRSVGRTLAQAQADGSETPFVIAALLLLILTGARLSEILTLKWQHVDLNAGLLRLPDFQDGRQADPPERGCHQRAACPAAHGRQPIRHRR